ncbi:TlpA disulfide reductase family protein [Pedobacter sp. Du54]|uniref:TlpA family protein disulfide reductase n=1 Tax=Pedobacter anseongensis TaxID=3133439 RepID=UPI0030B58579
MKLIKTVIFFLTISISAFAQKEMYVQLKGKLKGFNNQVQIEDMSEFQYLLPPSSTRMIIPDTAGNFNIKFKITSPNYFRLGRNALYLSPNDNLEVYIDYSDPRKATFRGLGAEANSYLKNTPFPKGGSFVEAGKNIKATVEETIATVEEMALKREKELAMVTKITPEFRRLETARIKADLINSIISGNVYSIMKLKLKDEAAKTFSESYKAISAKYITKYAKDFTDASFMKLVVYRDIAEELIANGGKTADIDKIKEFYTASNLVRNLQKQSDKQLLAPFKTEIDNLKVPTYKAATKQMLTYLMAFGKGDTAVDFIAQDQNGQKINLSSLKGKVIYVDLWATWCGPCMQEMPSYEKLKQKYAANPNVVFVSLSIDDNEGLWKASLAQRKADGQQWLINRSKLQAYNIVEIPRSLLIDKNFKMVNMVAPMPSEAAADKEIAILLK